KHEKRARHCRRGAPQRPGDPETKGGPAAATKAAVAAPISAASASTPTVAPGAFADARYRFNVRRDAPGGSNKDATSRSAYVRAAASAVDAVRDAATSGRTNTNARRTRDTATNVAASSRDFGIRE